MPYKFVINDPLQPHWTIKTERKNIKPGKFGWGKTSDAELAKEIKQRRPWTIVREYEDNNGMKATRPTFLMPLAPWKYDRERHEHFAAMYNAYYKHLKEQYEKQTDNETPSSDE